MKIAYGKLGRSFPLTRETCGEVGGDIEVVNLMMRMLQEGHEVHLVGRNRADAIIPGVVNHWAKGGIFDNCPVPTRNIDDPEYNDFLDFLKRQTELLPEFDAWVIWLGQHGSSLHCVPAVQDGMAGQFTEPLISLINYGYPIVHMVNQKKVRPIWLCPDPRNMIKMRDLHDPNQCDILAQYKDTKNNTFYDEPADTLRKGNTRYVYSGIEMLATREVGAIHSSHIRPEEFADRQRFGILVNEGPTSGKNPRLRLMKQWVMPLQNAHQVPVNVAGTWTGASQADMGLVIAPVPNQEVGNWLAKFATTVTFPASSTGWATAKPWECFLNGVICFKHPDYDDQRHIYGSHMPKELRKFLSPYNSTEFIRRVVELTAEQWAHYAELQLQYYYDSHERLKGGYAFIEAALSSF